MKRALFGLMLNISSMLLMSCAYQHPEIIPVAHTTAGIRAQAIRNLRHEGAQVFTVGETVRVVLPSDALFTPASANFISQQNNLILDTAQLIKTYRVVNVMVNAYCERSGSADYARALTTSQAQAVSQKLWSLNIDARQISAIGNGYSNLVAISNVPAAQAENRRVEISFQFYPRVNGYE